MAALALICRVLPSVTCLAGGVILALCGVKWWGLLVLAGLILGVVFLVAEDCR